MNKRIFAAFVAASALIVQAAMSGASADAGPASHVDSMSASAGGSTVSVTGAATFVDIPVLVGDSSAGTAMVSGIGADITTATISRPSGGTKINFTMGIADQPPTLNGTPEAIAYQWVLTLMQGETPIEVGLWAARSAQARAPGNTTGVFVVDTCVPNPPPQTGETCSGAPVTGKIADGVVEWQLTTGQLKGALAGQVLTMGDQPPSVIPTAGGGVWWPGIHIDAGIHEFDYAIPGKALKIGIAPAGTAPEAVSLTTNATVSGTNNFTGSLPKPAQPGSYIVVAQACYGAESCGLSSTTITI